MKKRIDEDRVLRFLRLRGDNGITLWGFIFVLLMMTTIVFMVPWLLSFVGFWWHLSYLVVLVLSVIIFIALEIKNSPVSKMDDEIDDDRYPHPKVRK